MSKLLAGSGYLMLVEKLFQVGKVILYLPLSNLLPLFPYAPAYVLACFFVQSIITRFSVSCKLVVIVVKSVGGQRLPCHGHVRVLWPLVEGLHLPLRTHSILSCLIICVILESLGIQLPLKKTT